ncbi:MAG: anti-sigma factor [Burkholderiaceae bacterium]
MSLPEDPDRNAVAAEYVLGLLTEAERQQVEFALETDPVLARHVGFWQDKLLVLVSVVTPLDPSSTLWPRISAALPPESAPANGRAPDPSGPGWWAGFWGRLAVWRAISAVAVAVAIASSATLALREPEIRVYYAVLNSPDDQPGWLVQARSNGSFRMIPLDTASTVPEGKSWELWTKADGAAGPTSLGSVTAGQPIEFSSDRLPALGTNQLFEITVEPPEGSPIGKPTGPVIFIGKTKGI